MSTQLAWLAGIVDGEGCIRITLSRGRTHSLILTVSNTDRALIERCALITGAGRIHTRKWVTGRKAMHDWAVFNKTAQIILRRILPYMVETNKRQCATLALEFQCGVIGRWQPLTDAEFEARDKLRWSMRNAR